MAKTVRASQAVYGHVPTNLKGFDALVELALDMRSAWNHAGDQLWRSLDPELWELTQNPWLVLQTVSRDKLEHELSDPSLRKEISALLRAKRRAATEPAWFQQNYPSGPLTCVAYFSMEFMLGEALPIYSGGLGNVAGDQLKAASDLGVPVIGISLLYQQGYFRQVIAEDGSQQAVFPYNDPGQLPVTPVRRPDGEWLRTKLTLPGCSLWLRAWQVDVGRVKLYLLDSNDPANPPTRRGITSELYGGGQDLRLSQELVLGIGGWRLLSALGVQPEVCHLNEGHAAFAVLERALGLMEESGKPFEVALAATRPGNLFTTHTAVDAGFDRFSPAHLRQYLGDYAEQRLGIAFDDLLGLGRRDPTDSSEPFNMAYLAIRGSGAVNGVSRLHGEVSRRLFAPLFPRWPIEEVPVRHVTNGVHTPSWDSAAADRIWTESCGKARWMGHTEHLGGGIGQLPDAVLWQFRTASTESLVNFVREQLSRQLSATGCAPEAVNETEQILSPEVLTLGFARRFVAYKRPNLLLHDPDRLVRLLNNPERPVQLVIAGKAHPADQEGQALVQQWVRFVRQPEVRRRAVFLADYDMKMTERLVQGVDVWLNTPRRPWEASGTSGMKVLVNGGINFSELDGWWAEAYAPEVGWSLGDGLEHDDDPAWDAKEAEELYTKLENEVVPEFYTRDAKGVPVAWVERMRQSMAHLTPRFSANRVVREYTVQHYLPAAAAYLSRAGDNCKLAEQLVTWRHELQDKWPALRFGELKVETRDDHFVFEVEVPLGGLEPTMLSVQLYADGVAGGPPISHEMQLVSSGNGGGTYRASVRATRPASDFTPRAVPRNPAVALPLEVTAIAWQR
ncbi:MAG: alpha-glucan family phosphorylase [Acidimicrobiales bacterium]